MIETLKILLGGAVLVGMTGFAYAASTRGVGLAGALDKPVSVRQDSSSAGRRGAGYYYFSGRRHGGGGYGYGK